jgi:hypothetical protein
MKLKIKSSIIYFVTIIIILGFGYSVYLNINNRDFLTIENYINRNSFFDDKIHTLLVYEGIRNTGKTNLSYYDFTICELKRDSNRHFDINSNINHLLFFTNRKQDLLGIVNNQKEKLSQYLNDKQDIDCSDYDYGRNPF